MVLSMTRTSRGRGRQNLPQSNVVAPHTKWNMESKDAKDAKASRFLVQLPSKPNKKRGSHSLLFYFGLVSTAYSSTTLTFNYWK